MATSAADTLTGLKAWAAFAGCVLIVGVLYWAQSVIVPVALAALLTFVLTPPVAWLERRVGSVTAVLVTVMLVFALLGLSGWALMRQLDHLAGDLPHFRGNIMAKIADVRGVSKGGSMEKIQQTLDQIQTGLEGPAAKGAVAQPVVVTNQRVAGLTDVTWLGPFLAPVTTGLLVLTLVIFMLLDRRGLRDRLLGLVGHGRLAVTTKAFDEAGARVSRQLLMQSLVNAIYGVLVALGLYLLGAPYPWLWGVFGAALRFIPYVGPIAGAGVPILVSLAALPGWTGPLSVIALFVVLELVTNLVLETQLYAGAIGVSQVALLISVAFWTFLWGPLGLLMATPLTVCLVVMGKHVPGLEFIGTLIGDSTPLAPESALYQRLLARDISEAAELVDQHVQGTNPDSVYDALLLPALAYAERDRLEGRLTPEEEGAIIESTRELVSDAAQAIDSRPAPVGESGAPPATPAAPSGPLCVLGYPSNGGSDKVALAMLAASLRHGLFSVDMIGSPLLASELVSLVKERQVSIVCLVDLPPSPPSKTRYFVKRLRAALPDLRIIVGRWAPPALRDDDATTLLAAGATVVTSTLNETETYLLDLRTASVAASTAPSADTVHAA